MEVFWTFGEDWTRLDCFVSMMKSVEPRLRMTLQLSTLLVLLLLGGTHARSNHLPPIRRLHHPDHSSLRILPRQITTRQPTSHSKLEHFSRRFSPAPITLQHSDTFLLSLNISSLFPKPIHLLLRPTENLFHPSAKITYPDGSSEPLRREDARVYTGDVLRSSWSDRIWAEQLTGGKREVNAEATIGHARVMVHNISEKGLIWEGVFNVYGINYHVLTPDHYERVKSDHDSPIISDDGSLVVFSDTDMYHDAFSQPHASTCSHDSLAFNIDPSHPLRARSLPNSNFNLMARDDIAGSTVTSNYINFINSTSGCPQTPQIVYMGVALDCNYVSTYGSTDAARTQTLNNWNTISALYKSTFNISLGIIELVVQNTTCPDSSSGTVEPSWNVGCSNNVTLDGRLSSFSQWRGYRSGDGAGIWHLMSACPTQTEVGVAWLGTLCQSSSSDQSGAFVSGTAISTTTTVEWSLISHEIGHNFGAIHDCTSGCSLSGTCCPYTTSTCDAGSQFIMNPTTSNKEVKFSPCTLGNICSGIGTKALSTSCIQTPVNQKVISLHQCGNGIVEAGEECDPGYNTTSICCDTATCKFTSGSVCDPSNSACCTSSCQLASAGTICRAATNPICDTAEVCTGTNATCPADVVAADGTSCGDNGLACADGICTSLDLQCQTAGASMNLTTACGERDDTSCVVTCKDPTTANQCVVLQTELIDGSPCGYGGHCYNGTCNAGSASAEVSAWYSQNLQISIPVTIIGALAIIVTLFILSRLVYRCMKLRRQRQNARPLPPIIDANSLPVNTMNGSHRPVSVANPPMGQPGHTSYGRYDANGIYDGHYQQNSPGRGDHHDQSLAGYYGDGPGSETRDKVDGGGHQSWPRHTTYSENDSGRNNGWVDESFYNGPHYGAQDVYGR